jgi:hypothetical protein
LIVLDIIGNVSRDFWNTIDLDNIEPFTIVLFQEQDLFSFGGVELKKQIQLDTDKSIFGSSTLYSEEIREERSILFEAFLGTHTKLSEVEMYDFHRHAEEENQENGLVINRNEELKTFSITQAVIERNKVTIFHYDLMAQEDFSTSFTTI